MSLDKDKLKQNFITWMEIPYTDKIEALTNFTEEYDSYAQDAEATSGGEFEIANKSGMLSILLTLPPVGTPESASEIFSNALSIYWVGALLPPSNVSATFPPETLKPILSFLFSIVDPEKTKEQYAEDFAEAIHNVTITVQTVLPISPPISGFVF